MSYPGLESLLSPTIRVIRENTVPSVNMKSHILIMTFKVDIEYVPISLLRRFIAPFHLLHKTVSVALI